MPLSEDRFFDPNPEQRAAARDLYAAVADLPLVCPHGHVDPRLFTDPDYRFGTPAELIVISDHYVFRMLYSQGIPLEHLGIPAHDGTPVEQDHRKIWQTFAEHFYLFRGTPTGIWLTYTLEKTFGIPEKLSAQSAQVVYDQIAARLAEPAFRPRALYERFNVEVLCTTDAATDPLAHHKAIRESGWGGDIRPSFRPDALIDISARGWRKHIHALGDITGTAINSYTNYIRALEDRRAFFKAMGAAATDHDVYIPYTGQLTSGEVNAIFKRALKGRLEEDDPIRFTGHMLMEMARMSTEDGLAMQLHTGSYRNHNLPLFERFGPDAGGDMPIAAEFTTNLLPLLNAYGSSSRLTLVLFTLDESTYSRELAPLAGHYPAVRLGPPWWFHDSLNGMARYFDQVMETAGLYNTAGFNDDTRAFPAIPARHDLWRRAACDWLAGLVVRGLIDADDAHSMAHDCAYTLAKRTYKLED